MPPNPIRDAQLFRDGTDVMRKKLLSPTRLLPRFWGLANTQLSIISYVFFYAPEAGK
jgi:hypothetical protein